MQDVKDGGINGTGDFEQRFLGGVERLPHRRMEPFHKPTEGLVCVVHLMLREGVDVAERRDDPTSDRTPWVDTTPNDRDGVEVPLRAEGTLPGHAGKRRVGVQVEHDPERVPAQAPSPIEDPSQNCQVGPLPAVFATFSEKHRDDALAILGRNGPARAELHGLQSGERVSFDSCVWAGPRPSAMRH
ncbi:hypothetical protein [Microbacterium sp. P5_E9]